MKSFHVGIIGSGNLASHLSKALSGAGVDVAFILSRNAVKGRAVAKSIGSRYQTILPTPVKGNNLLFICTSDEAIEEMFHRYKDSGYTLIHCSGMQPLPFYPERKAGTGVFYPVQSFSKNITVDWKIIPLCLEASDAATLRLLKKIAGALGGPVKILSSEQRAVVHLAAVFANNFSNAQFAIAAEILHAHQLPFDLMKPLILQTALKVQHHLPAEVQTGPAKRKDKKTIQAHLALLKDSPSTRKIYRDLTDYLLKKYNEEQ